jgi:glycosyltransferase involved in cell wall biosynthesis
MATHNSFPFFTVIIATYNRADLITRALNSLAGQSENDWEAIIVDDGSTDNTYSRLVPFMEQNSMIRYSKYAHQGMAMAKNAGMQSASGRYVTFLDSDDEYHPLHLETRKAILQEHPGVNFLYGRVKVVGNQFVPDRFDRNKLVNLNNCIIGGNFFIERNTANMLKGFRNITIGADADLFDRTKCAGIKMMEVFLPTYIYHHDNEDSITNRMLIDSD